MTSLPIGNTKFVATYSTAAAIIRVVTPGSNDNGNGDGDNNNGGNGNDNDNDNTDNGNNDIGSTELSKEDPFRK